MNIFDETPCQLGEGALWHPKRQELFWFDILARQLYARGLDDKIAQIWDFEEMFSAMGWIDENHLVMVSETGLWIMNLQNQALEYLIGVEADNPKTRSNDGRVDRQGGFWFGTMSKTNALGEGAFYRYHKGRLCKIKSNLSTPNSICFSPDGKLAYFADTPKQRIHYFELDSEGWPVRDDQVFRDLRMDGRIPDGSIVDADGNLWNAQWGSGRVAIYDHHGHFVQAYESLASQLSCPALGGPNFNILFATSASEKLPNPRKEMAGQTFYIETDYKGLPENAFILENSHEERLAN